MGKSDHMVRRPTRRRNHSDARKKYPKGYGHPPLPRITTSHMT